MKRDSLAHIRRKRSGWSCSYGYDLSQAHGSPTFIFRLFAKFCPFETHGMLDTTVMIFGFSGFSWKVWNVVIENSFIIDWHCERIWINYTRFRSKSCTRKFKSMKKWTRRQHSELVKIFTNFFSILLHLFLNLISTNKLRMKTEKGEKRHEKNLNQFSNKKENRTRMLLVLSPNSLEKNI